MAIQSTATSLHATSEQVEGSVALVKEFSLSYLLATYVDRHRWSAELSRVFSIDHLCNQTDFNYSRCFSYLATEEDWDFSVSDVEFRHYLAETGPIHAVVVLISVLAPYVFFRHLQYELQGGQLHLRRTDGASRWRSRVDSALLQFCGENGLLLVDEKDLIRSVQGVSLELHGPDPSVFNLLFEDGRSVFPY